MASTTALSKKSSVTQWDKEFVLASLPPWIYTENEQPKDVADCQAKLSNIRHILQDIDLQISIKDTQLQLRQGEVTTVTEYNQWLLKILKAKQSYNYLLNAYNNWLILNSPEALDLTNRFDTLVEILIEEPDNYLTELKRLLR